MDDVSTDGANAAKAARWAEGCRRHQAIRQLVDYSKQPLPRSVVEDVAWELGVSLRARTRSHANQALHRNRGRAQNGIGNPVSH